MLALLLTLVLNHSVMAVGADRDDVDADFDLGYAILLGGLLILLVYQLIPRPRRKISYEEQEDIEEQEKINDPVPRNSAEADKDPDEDLLHAENGKEENEKADENLENDLLKAESRVEKNEVADENPEKTLLQSEYREPLRAMLANLSTKNVTPLEMTSCISGIWEILINLPGKELKEAIDKKATTLDHLEGMCRQVAAEFAGPLVSLINEQLLNWVPKGYESDALTTEELLQSIISMELTRKAMSYAPDPYLDGRMAQCTYRWAESATAEGRLDGWETTIEQYLADLAEEAIDRLSDLCSSEGPDTPTQAEQAMLKAFAEGVLRDLRS
ncbi:unnamed protein product, partial [Mesorhabditis spiculigera]